MKEFYKKILKILFVFIASVNSVSSEELVKIGLLVPLSGESSYIGQSIIQSVRLGIKNIVVPKLEEELNNNFQKLINIKEISNIKEAVDYSLSK